MYIHARPLRPFHEQYYLYTFCTDHDNHVVNTLRHKMYIIHTQIVHTHLHMQNTITWPGKELLQNNWFRQVALYCTLDAIYRELVCTLATLVTIGC